MKADVIIIGAGIIGASCAYFLSRRGVKVLILERDHLGSGASGATAALISISGTATTSEPVCRLSVESYNLLLEIKEDFDRSLEIISGGILYLAIDEHQATELHPIYQGLCELGVDCKLLDRSEAIQLDPLLSGGVTAAVYNPLCFHVNPFRLLEAYAGRALQRGSKIQYGVNVLDIESSHNRIERIVTNKGDYYSDWVVVAGGADTPQILSSMDFKIPILPARGQVLVTEACPPMTDHVLMFVNDLYIKQTANGNFFLGGQNEFVGFEKGVTLQKLITTAGPLVKTVPILRSLRALHFFSGLRPVCEDNLPIISPAPGCSKLIVASGHGRIGVRLSAGTGKAVSELILDKEVNHPIEMFSLDRFL